MDELASIAMNQKLRIGFDGTCLANRRGFGRFARGILKGLVETNPGHEIHVVIDEPSSQFVTLPQGVTRQNVALPRSPSAAAAARGNRSAGEIWTIAKAVSRMNFDLYYLPSSFTYFPLLPTQKSIVTMHDTLAVDRPDLVFPTKRGRWFWWLKEQAARWNTSRITTVSETSRRDLARFFRLDESRIGLLTEGVEEIFLKPESELPGFEKTSAGYGIPPHLPFWLYVGGLSPHKNLVRLIEAFSAMPESVGNLVLVGDFGDTFHTHVPELRQKAVDCGVNHRVIFTGFVPDDALATLYHQSRAVILPSLWEGFGLPAAEAMACGTALLHSHAGSLPEVVGDAGLAFDPLDLQDMREKWWRLATDDSLRDQLAHRGLTRSEHFRWQVAGKMLWSEIAHVLGPTSAQARCAG